MRKLAASILSFCTRHAGLVLVLAVLATGVFGYYATKVKVNADLAGLLPVDSPANKAIKEYGGSSPASDVLVVGLKGDDLFRKDTLAAFSAAADRIAGLPGIMQAVTPFNLPAFSKTADGRLDLGRMWPAGSTPATSEEIASFRSRLLGSPYARNLSVSSDGRMLVAFFQVRRAADYSPLMRQVTAVTDGLCIPGTSVHVSGTIPLGVRTAFYLNRDVIRLVLLAVLVLLVFYYLGFRSKRAVLLASLCTCLGAVWAVGFMGMVGFEFTLISIAAPPLILIFGNEYGIYILNEYFRIGGRKDAPDDYIKEAGLNVARPIFMAFITTIVGFLSLCATDITQTRQFALVASFGSFACGLLALFLLPALLALFKKPDEDRTRKVIDGPLASLMDRSAALVNGRPRVILASFLVAVAIFGVFAGRLKFNTDSVNYFPQNDPAIQDMYAITGKIGGFDVVNVTFNAPAGRKFYFLDPAVLTRVAAVEKEFEKNPDVCYLISVPRILEDINLAMEGKADIPANRATVMTMARFVGLAGGALFGSLVNRDYTRLTLVFRVYNSSTGRFMDEYRFRELVGFFNRTIAANPVGDSRPVIWGDIMRNLDLANSLRSSLAISMVMSLVIIILISTLNFRSLKLGVFSVIPLVAGLLLNFAFMAVVGIPLDMTTIMVANVTIGVGIDSAIYLIIQYRRELAASFGDPAVAVRRTLRDMGRSIVLSTSTIVAGLLVFTTAAFKPIMYFGLLVLFSLTVTAVFTVFLLPAALKLDSERALRRRLPGGSAAAGPEGRD